MDHAGLSGRDVRIRCRNGAHDRPTAGAAPGFVQANLVILKSRLAADFERFCRLNPKPCPLLEVTRPGQFDELAIARDADLRTDLPRYCVFRHGQREDRPTTIEPYWEDDFVSFLIGCSFTFEGALLKAGVPVRHLEEECNVPMYRTNIPCESVGVFHGPLIVSMRPMTAEQAARADRVTSEYPRVHGGPIQIGDPSAIGVRDLTQPDYGEAVSIHPGEIPVFWACGVTPMEAIQHARPEIAITHEPGYMFVTDLRDQDLRGANPD